MCMINIRMIEMVIIIIVSRGRFPLFGPFGALSPYPAVIAQPLVQPVPIPVPTQPSPLPLYSALLPAKQTCICVPLGTCSVIGTVPVISLPIQDGSGAIDIRIVNNVRIQYLRIH